MRLKIFIILGIFLVTLPVKAEVLFDNLQKELKASGSCVKDVTITVLHQESKKIWGSFSAPCENGEYNFSENLLEWEFSDGNFIATAGDSPSAQTTNFSILPEVSSSVVIDPVISINPEPPSLIEPIPLSPMEELLASIFNVGREILDATQKFISIISESILTTVFRIAPGGDITLPEGENQITGRSTLLANASEVFIYQSKIGERSKIFITPLTLTEMPLIVTKKTAGEGFGVGISRPVDKNISFDWVVIHSYPVGRPVVEVTITEPTEPLIEPKIEEVPAELIPEIEQPSSTLLVEPETLLDL